MYFRISLNQELDLEKSENFSKLDLWQLWPYKTSKPNMMKNVIHNKQEDTN